MSLQCYNTSQYFLFAVLFVLLCVTLSTAQAKEDEEDCGHGCQSIDADTSQMTRCVRYACRRRVFRYFIRFGKRGGAGTDDAPERPVRPRYPLYQLDQHLNKAPKPRQTPLNGHRTRHLGGMERIQTSRMTKIGKPRRTHYDTQERIPARMSNRYLNQKILESILGVSQS